MDVIALVGRYRYGPRASVPEICAELVWRDVVIFQRSVTNLLDRYDELVATAAGDPDRLRARFKDQGRVILAIDGLQPQMGHEVLRVIRGCLSGTAVLANPLLVGNSRRSGAAAAPGPGLRRRSDGRGGWRRTALGPHRGRPNLAQAVAEDALVEGSAPVVSSPLTKRVGAESMHVGVVQIGASS